MEGLDEMLKKLTFKDLDNNKLVLTEMGAKLSVLLSNSHFQNDSFVENLYKSTFDDDWFFAQCHSVCNQINKILDDGSKFHEYYDPILTESDWLLLTQEIIYDLHQLNNITNNKFGFNASTFRPNNLTSNLFFLHAKFAYFTKKYIAETTNRNFLFSSMPTLIRQAIEIKIKNMIGLEKVTSKTGGFKMVPISSILEFFNDNQTFLEMPLSIGTLTTINRWTNTFVHTGVVPFCWQSLEAIDLIECLFSIQDDETGALNINGFSYISKGTSLDTIKKALDEHFKAEFFLRLENIEGSLKN